MFRIFTLLSLLCFGLAALQGAEDHGKAASIARGSYLVNGIGMCADCHTPKNNRGEFLENQHLRGASLDFTPRSPVPNWSPVAPKITGLVGWTDEQALKLFTTGIGRGDKPLRPPMPRYKMSEADAQSVIDYLRSLKQ